jgi:hypothetical protein
MRCVPTLTFNQIKALMPTDQAGLDFLGRRWRAILPTDWGYRIAGDNPEDHDKWYFSFEAQIGYTERIIMVRDERMFFCCPEESPWASFEIPLVLWRTDGKSVVEQSLDAHYCFDAGDEMPDPPEGSRAEIFAKLWDCFLELILPPDRAEIHEMTSYDL